MPGGGRPVPGIGGGAPGTPAPIGTPGGNAPPGLRMSVPCFGPLLSTSSDGRAGADAVSGWPLRINATESGVTAVTMSPSATFSPTRKGLAACPSTDSRATPCGPAAMTPTTWTLDGAAAAPALGAGGDPNSWPAWRRSLRPGDCAIAPAGAIGLRGENNCRPQAAQIAHSAANSSSEASRARGKRSRMVESGRSVRGGGRRMTASASRPAGIIDRMNHAAGRS